MPPSTRRRVQAAGVSGQWTQRYCKRRMCSADPSHNPAPPMIPAIGYMVGLYVLTSFARWIRDDDGPLIMLYALGMLVTLFCLVGLTVSVMGADQAMQIQF